MLSSLLISSWTQNAFGAEKDFRVWNFKIGSTQWLSQATTPRLLKPQWFIQNRTAMGGGLNWCCSSTLSPATPCCGGETWPCLWMLSLKERFRGQEIIFKNLTFFVFSSDFSFFLFPFPGLGPQNLAESRTTQLHFHLHLPLNPPSKLGASGKLWACDPSVGEDSYKMAMWQGKKLALIPLTGFSSCCLPPPPNPQSQWLAASCFFNLTLSLQGQCTFI